MPHLTKIQSKAFENLTGKLVTLDGSETCIGISIAHNENLEEIDVNAFSGLRPCYLDLSDNKLKSIPQNLTDWENIDLGFNLQFNPWQCDCNNQWMLERILNTLYYKDDLQQFLVDLRCQSPEEISGNRFVKFLNHHNPFCNDDVHKSNEEKSGKLVHHSSVVGASIFNLNQSNETNDFQFTLKPFSSGFIIIISLCAIILILMIIVGVKWQKDQNEKFIRNRSRLYYDYDYY
jgi:hypothetical protein